MDTMTYTGKLIITSCWCGIQLAIPEDLYNFARTRRTSVHCPLGHTFVYGNTTKEENERLSANLARERAANDQLRAEVKHVEARRRATKGALTKTQRRIHKGVCPHCNRHFNNVEKHMESKHPELDPT